jgi:chloramphenicol-sensitive protein RarD
VPLSVLGLMQYLSPTIQLVCALTVFNETLAPERLVGFVVVWVALVVLAADAVGTWRRRGSPVVVPEPV